LDKSVDRPKHENIFVCSSAWAQVLARTHGDTQTQAPTGRRGRGWGKTHTPSHTLGHTHSEASSLISRRNGFLNTFCRCLLHGMQHLPATVLPSQLFHSQKLIVFKAENVTCKLLFGYCLFVKQSFQLKSFLVLTKIISMQSVLYVY